MDLGAVEDRGLGVVLDEHYFGEGKASITWKLSCLNAIAGRY
jgi:hypothetical protein